MTDKAPARPDLSQFKPVRLDMPSSLSRGPSRPASGARESISANVPDLGRYEDLGLIGEGGMGEVRRVLDRDLNRVMAMKVIRSGLLEHSASLARFVEEAQATAQLEHPGIVPVHELGQLPDGRFYFTMREVRGQTLKAVIHQVHARGVAPWQAATTRAGSEGWTFRRLIDAFHKVCEAVAFAHSRGVLHRDLKPSNVMVGSYGEVMVVDWGLARVRSRPEPVIEPRAASRPGDADNTIDTASLDAPPPAIITSRSSSDQRLTLFGTVTGTPAYMPPEQALGDVEKVGPASDVYALGAMLYEILCGRPPYDGPDVGAVLIQVIAGPPPPPGQAPPIASEDSTLTGTLEADALVDIHPPSLEAPTGATIPVPEELEAIRLKAMAREPADRFPDAGALAREVAAWLEGVQRRERALSELDQARALEPGFQDRRARATALREEAARLLAVRESWEPSELKQPAWRLEDQARQLELEADLEEVTWLQLLRSALTHDPDLPEAHAKLADYYRTQQEVAESGGDESTAARCEVLLRAHDRGRYTAWLRGEGRLSLFTDPPGAEVELFRYVEEDRRLVPRPAGSLGRTPLEAVSLPIGSYLLILRAPGCIDTRYPVLITREQHWDGIPPGEGRPMAIRLPRAGELGPDDVYVPAGWFINGGDTDVNNPIPRRALWSDAFAIRRFPVTNREYLDFLNDLVASGRHEEAERWAPRERGGTVGTYHGEHIYGRDADGRFHLQPDAEGDIWQPDWPVVMIHWRCAMAYAAWEGRGRGRPQSGKPWRLPGEFEWEKAARGVDGRFYPWGNFADPAWARTLGSTRDRQVVAPVDSYPIDESPYGVRGMGGNVRDWVIERGRPEGALVEGRRLVIVPAADDDDGLRLYRGGAWMAVPKIMRSAQRPCVSPLLRDWSTSFRILCRM